MEQITVVIGDRLGKGQKVAAGVEKMQVDARWLCRAWQRI